MTGVMFLFLEIYSYNFLLRLLNKYTPNLKIKAKNVVTFEIQAQFSLNHKKIY